MTNTNLSMFKSTENRGFQMTFENGIVISVQFDVTNYCSRRSLAASLQEKTPSRIVESPNAEIAIWCERSRTGAFAENNHWFSFGYDNVKGWCSTNEVAQWISICYQAQSLENLKELAIANGLLIKDEEPEVDSAGFTAADR